MIEYNFIFVSKHNVPPAKEFSTDDNKDCYKNTEKYSLQFKICNSKVFVKGSKQHARHHNPFNF